MGKQLRAATKIAQRNAPPVATATLQIQPHQTQVLPSRAHQSRSRRSQVLHSRAHQSLSRRQQSKKQKINVRCPRVGAIWMVSNGATIPMAGIKACGATNNQETVKHAEEFGAAE